MPNKPIWTEGLLISQHHFQQQDRYHEALLRDRLSSVVHYSWGITDLEIDDRRSRRAISASSDSRPSGPMASRCAAARGTKTRARATPVRSAFPSDAAKLEIFVALAHESDAAGNMATGDETRSAGVTRAWGAPCPM